MAITLAPTAALSVTINLTAAQAPYFTQWYADNKLPLETPSDFLVRLLTPTVVDYATGKAIKVASDTFDASKASLHAEANTIKASI